MGEVMRRAIERLLTTIIGGLCSFLGSRRFVCISMQKKGEGKIEFPRGTAMFVTGVGLGRSRPCSEPPLWACHSARASFAQKSSSCQWMGCEIRPGGL
jgi:hypothetical protein